MSTIGFARPRRAKLLLRGAVALGCALLLSGCVVYPGGPGYYGYYGRPAYYGGYYGHPYYWR
jgi:hypothetical protein